MKVPFVHGPNDLRLCDVELPHAGPRDVVLRVGTVGICGSDLGYVMMGGVAGPAQKPFPLGHEISGTIIEAGADVVSVSPGDRVIVNPLVDLVGNGGPEGGFAEQLLVRDVVGRPGSLVRLPDGLSLDVGALVEPLAVATHALNRLGMKAGDRVAIFGAGPIGLAALIILRHWGIEEVVVFELSSFRRERAERLGALAALDPRRQPPREALMALHGTTPVFRTDAPRTTHFLEASGAPILPDIVDFARAGAAICVVSSQKKLVAVDFRIVMAKELTLTGSLGYPSEFSEVLDMLEKGEVDPEPMISHRFDGADFMAAFEIARQQDRSAKVLVRYDA